MSVKIGKLKIGGDHSIVVQSMTNTDTNDIESSVDQCIRIAEAGAQMVRLTVQGHREVESLSRIRRLLFEKGYNFPLIADVHFSPRTAEEAAKIVEKVRINPGNYTDKNLGKKVDFSEEEYMNGLKAIREKILPLLSICREIGTALRIGVNHGSLSDRIMSRYGNTPEGMAESAMEFIRICNSAKFLNLVISMKASNTRVMAYACRLLVQKMESEKMVFPVHLGVTEAGAGNEGRVRSAVGIASLLQQGIGDTIRVSLTEEPEDEIPAALEIANYFGRKIREPQPEKNHSNLVTSYKKRKTNSVLNIGGTNLPVVVESAILSQAGNSKPLRKADFIFYSSLSSVPAGQPALLPAAVLVDNIKSDNVFPLGTIQDYFNFPPDLQTPFFLLFPEGKITKDHLSIFKKNKSIVIVAESQSSPDPSDLLTFFSDLQKYKVSAPVIIKKIFNLNNPGKFLIRAAGESGLFFLDGLADGLWLSNSGNEMNITDLCFDILQASRVRTTTTEYISCPSCGRTLFDIKKILGEIKTNTSHLTGLKIAVMGCIVNGPGEMADADYGYVGSGAGKVSLYRNRQLVLKNIPVTDAIDRLIELIKLDGKWMEK